MKTIKSNVASKRLPNSDTILRCCHIKKHSHKNCAKNGFKDKQAICHTVISKFHFFFQFLGLA